MQKKSPDSCCYRTELSHPGNQLIIRSSLESVVPLGSPTRNQSKSGQPFLCRVCSSSEFVPSPSNLSISHITVFGDPRQVPQGRGRSLVRPVHAYLQSWNLNLQREVMADFSVMVGYFGSKGTHLVVRRNINQPIDGVRPFPALSMS